MRKIYSTLLFLFILFKAFATHQRGAEITYTHVSGYTYSIKIVTYTRTSSPADRPVLDSVYFGDETQGQFVRLSKDSVAPDISNNIYIENHTYPGQGAYKIHFEDPNRDADIVNIPNSVNVPLSEDCYIVVFNDSLYCAKNSAYFATMPIFNPQAGKDYHQNVTAIDPDNDSLSYELIDCLGAGDVAIPGYFLPQMISVNSFNGELTWKSEGMYLGIYSFAIRVNEWRRGFLVGYIIRDFQVLVNASNDLTYGFGNINSFPVDSNGNYVDTLSVGDTLSLSFTYGDSLDPKPTMLAYGAAFLVPQPAIFTTTESPHRVDAQLKWIIDSGDVRNSPYVFTFRGNSPNSDILVDLTLTTCIPGLYIDSCPAFPLLAIKNICYDSCFLLYPNPSFGAFHLSINNIYIMQYNIYIYDALGKQVYQKQETATSEIDIDISKNVRGIYFLKVINEEGIYLSKIILL